MQGKIIIRAERCKSCMLCIEVCRHGSIQEGTALNQAGYIPVVFDESGKCTACALCALRCPEVAIDVYSEV